MTYCIAWLATGCAVISGILSVLAVCGVAGAIPTTMYGLLAIAMGLCVLWTAAASPIGQFSHSWARVRYLSTLRTRAIAEEIFHGSRDPLVGFGRRRGLAVALLGLVLLSLFILYSVTNRNHSQSTAEVNPWSMESLVAGRQPTSRSELGAERREAQREFASAFMTLIFSLCALALHHRTPDVIRLVAAMEQRDRMVGR